MAFPTEQCFFVETDGWTEALLKHPAMKFMEGYAEALQSGAMYSDAQPFGTWHTTDFAYTNESGQSYTGAEAFEKHREMYKAFLSEFHHRPQFAFIKETEDGYDCFGSADLYANYKVPGDKNVTDPDGKKWQIKSSGAWRMRYRKDTTHPDGLKMCATKLYANALPVFAGALKREMVPQEVMFMNAF